MGIFCVSFTVLFDDPFWVGIYERQDNKRYEVCRIVFGAEPKDNEVYEFLQKNFRNLRFSRPLKAQKTDTQRINPKRMQRIISRKTKDTGIGTKAQQALKKEQEQNKLERKVISKEQQREEKALHYELQKQKRKEKHRGH